MGGDLRQGDVIRPVNATSDHWEGPAIVITADCDLANNKHGGRISCVPVLPLSVYLHLFYLPPRLQRLQLATRSRAGDLVRTHQKQLPEYDEPISDDRVISWVAETSAQAVATTFSMTKENTAALGAYASSYFRLERSVREKFMDAAEALIESQVLLGHHKSESNSRRAFGKDLRSFLASLPGDAMFLNSLSTDLNQGYVCYLRVLREVSIHEIATRAIMRPFNVKFERVSRLRAPYVYALSQRLGNVFSAIGLPEEYEIGRQKHSDALAELISRVED
ncbi:hypothetical protein [Mycolicibacterium arenosum]|uniref:Uncharacterized protein n=1 Tax=Mycolicibacterium arenosum TaxID=2952157 RepID=A0ABT1LW22_9MYCO|nr:hypothetical protein [Mycolicibacterium sp. CAU 1645]MCP9271104.1 hypothetical protein [Mycolicibacterium sp. CAU 1645]